jgi:hypothetical protein
MSTGEVAETSEESGTRFDNAFNSVTEGFSGRLVAPPLLDALTKSVDNAKKLIDEGHSLAKQGPVYAMVFLSVALIASAIGYAEVHSSHPADFIASLVVASVLLIVAGILQLINNVAESRAAAQQVSELSSANERIIKYAIEHGVEMVAHPQEELPPPSSPDTST